MLTRHLFLSAQARLGNVPGYYLSSLAGLEYCGQELVVFVVGVEKADSTPGGFAGCLLFCCAGATRYGSPEGFRAAGLHEVTAAAKAGC